MELAWLPWIIVRLLVPLSIPKFPLYGSIAAILADVFDVMVWEAMGVTNLSEEYNRVDKWLDNYMYLIQGYAAWFWANKKARNMALGLLAYRTLGTILYEIFNQRILLLIFPNVFIFFFMYYVAYKHFTGKDPVKTTKALWLTVGILAIPKIAQEYLFHVAEFPLYQTVKNILGI